AAPERDLSRPPLFQVKLVWENVTREGLVTEETKLQHGKDSEVETARFDLTVTITDVGPYLVGTVNYNRDLFEGATIERLISHYTNVLRGIAGDSESPICELSLLGRKEKEQIVVEWNETERLYPDDRCVHELFAEQAERRPEQMALVCEGQGVSYRELNARANQLATYLQRLGVGPEVLVGLCLERSVGMVVAMVGVLKAGGAYLPLDPEHPIERLSFM